MVRTKTPKNPKTIRDYWKKTSARYREKKRQEEDRKLSNDFLQKPKLSLSEKHQNNKFKVVSNNQQR